MPGLELWWLGQSGFRLRPAEGGPVAFVDAYITPKDSRTWDAPVQPSDLAQADFVLCTHEHTDHFDQPAIRAAAAEPGSRFRLMVPRPLVDAAVALGVPPERVLGMQPGDVFEEDGMRVDVVAARHGVNVSDAYTLGQELSGGLVRYLGYIVEMGGARAYHAGDCIPYPTQEDQVKPRTPHLALLPINGRDYFRETERNLVGNMDPREAARLAVDLGAQVIVPMHWELFPHNRGYPSDLVTYVAETFPQLSVLVMGRSARMVYAPPPDGAS